MKIYSVNRCYDYEGCFPVIITESKDLAYKALRAEHKDVVASQSETTSVGLVTWLNGVEYDSIDYELYDTIENVL